VVVTNHVVDAVDNSGAQGGARGSGSSSFFNVKQRRLFGPPGDLRSSGRAVVPSLGWGSDTNSRRSTIPVEICVDPQTPTYCHTYPQLYTPVGTLGTFNQHKAIMPSMLPIVPTEHD
jgi:hypothetical protein